MLIVRVLGVQPSRGVIHDQRVVDMMEEQALGRGHVVAPELAELACCKGGKKQEGYGAEEGGEVSE